MGCVGRWSPGLRALPGLGACPVEMCVEPNLFGGFDLRQSDGKLVRCERKASGETECRVVQEGQNR